MIIVWHFRDLRIHDNPALDRAAASAREVLPVFIFHNKHPWTMGAASKWWLHHSLEALQKEYQKIGGKLILEKGDPKEVIQKLIKQTKAEGLYFNLAHEPEIYSFQQKLIQENENSNLEVLSFEGNYLIHPDQITNSSGKPFAVFTPFWNTFKKEYSHRKPLPAPRKIKTPNYTSERLDSLKLMPQTPWYKDMEKLWKQGHEEAKKQLKNFCRSHLSEYAKDRDFPFLDNTSMQSPYLHFGEISPKEIWEDVHSSNASHKEPFLRQLAWREFGNYFLHHNPQVEKNNWREEFDRFPWKESSKHLALWQQGKTGYPIVDAGMRQLWKTGWMHNRLRMVVASFLIKDLLIDWRKGAEWFEDTLVDADLANNTLGWQWVAGCGPDAAPYFRVFNPILQGEKFDPDGEFVSTYVPELKKLPKKWIHKPFEAPEEVLDQAGIVLDRDYPLPLVDHSDARKEALAAFEKIKKRS